MSVPLDRLYHYLADVVNHDLIIYRWTPHGSRNLEDMRPLRQYQINEFLNHLPIICHDQEPLNYLLYSQEQIKQCAKNVLIQNNAKEYYSCDAILDYLKNQHLRAATAVDNCYDLTMLLHSELNSRQLNLFSKKGFVPVYYWSHVLIAQDWFRYAEHDPKLNFDVKDIEKDFLIYNRAWSGTREYRLYFAQNLCKYQLLNNVQTTFNPIDQIHYTQHIFKNKNLQIFDHDLEQHLSPTSADSNFSADYNNIDYVKTGMEVVLETLFDDSRWHLTEKTLRPIACGKPFILCSTPGSLKYLRSYGFKTFDGLIDESYDLITDSKSRLDSIIAEIKRISSLSINDKHQLYTKLHKIAHYNKQRFFNGVRNQVLEEYMINLSQAVDTMQQNCTGKHHDVMQSMLKNN